MFSSGGFTFFHTFLSLIALGAGLVVCGQMMASLVSRSWVLFYLVTSVGTNLTGFLFPFTGFLPSHGVGILSSLLLAVAIYALYVRELEGRWRGLYAGTMVASVYFLAFVGIVQSFLKVPALLAIAPTGSEMPFAAMQGIALVFFVWLGVAAVRRFRP